MVLEYVSSLQSMALDGWMEKWPRGSQHLFFARLTDFGLMMDIEGVFTGRK